MSMSASKKAAINALYTTPTKNKKNEVIQICPPAPKRKPISVKPFLESSLRPTPPKVNFVNRLDAIRSYGYSTKDAVDFLKNTKLAQKELDEAIRVYNPNLDPIIEYTQPFTKAENDACREQEKEIRLGMEYENSNEEKEESEDELIEEEEEQPKKKTKYSNPDDDNDFITLTPKIVNRKKEMLLKKDYRLIGKGNSIKLESSSSGKEEDDDEKDEISRIEYEEAELSKDFIKSEDSIGTSDYEDDLANGDDGSEYEESFSDKEDELEKCYKEIKQLKTENHRLNRTVQNQNIVLQDSLQRQKSESSNADVYKVLYEHKKVEVQEKSDIIVSLRNELARLREVMTQKKTYQLTPARSDAPTIYFEVDD